MLDLSKKVDRDILRQQIEAELFRRGQRKELESTKADVSKIEALARALLDECRRHGVGVELVSSFIAHRDLGTASLTLRAADRRALLVKCL